MRSFLILLLTSTLITPSYADFYAQPLDNLKGNVDSLKAFEGKILLVVLFEPDCRWCYKQMKVFNRVAERCDHHLQPVAVGIHGHKRDLKKELRRAQVKFPALQASNSWLANFDGIAATPWTLIVGDSGQLVTQVRGYIAYEKIQQAFPSICI